MKTSSKSGPCVVKLILWVCVLAFGWPVIAHPNELPPLPEGCTIGVLPLLPEPPEQQILTCIPATVPWNGILVVYAHGYVTPIPALPEGELPPLPFDEIEDFFPLVDLFLEFGFAFATSGYSKLGYAIEQAGNDLNNLVNNFIENRAPFIENTPPSGAIKVLITGASEGGIITTMLVERFPHIYAGGLALCGPVGGMPAQIQYLGDFRVVFDYFFPDVIPLDGIYDEDPVNLVQWENIKDAIKTAIRNNPARARQLFKVTGVAADPEDPAESAIDLLKFSVLGTNDMVATSGGGHPYGNRFRWYHGSKNDFALNIGVERVGSDFRGRNYIRDFYNTTGNLTRPLVTLHTTGDDVVPFKHELLYIFKVLLQGRRDNLLSIPIIRDGHCEFEADEVLGAFVFLLLMTL